MWGSRHVRKISERLGMFVWVTHKTSKIWVFSSKVDSFRKEIEPKYVVTYLQLISNLAEATLSKFYYKKY